jgi:hypothetical protein
MTGDHGVFFAQWSAMLDQDAHTVIRAAAAQARDEAEWPVVIVEYLDDDAAAPLADLNRLRATLIEAQLVELGIERGRISRQRRPAAGLALAQDSQKLDIVVRDPA